MSQRQDQKHSRTLLLGIDAMDEKIVRQLLAEGKLPNLAKLSFRPLTTTIPPETPVAWSSASTGANPGRFWIYDFITRDETTLLPRLNLAIEKPGLVKTEYTSTMRGTPFWRRLNDADVPTTIIRWPVTFPAEEIKGRMLSGLGVVDIRGSMNSYAFYTDNSAFATGEGREKVVVVERSGGPIETHIAGPLIRKKGELRPITSPLNLTIADESVTLAFQGQTHTVRKGEWSPLLRTSFKLFAFHEITGIFEVFLESTSPLRMYMSSVQLDPENPALPFTSPAKYAKELAQQIGRYHTLGMPEDTKAVTEGKLGRPAFKQLIDRLEIEREKMLWYEMDRFSEGVLAVIFDSGDRLQHIFWQNRRGDAPVPPEIEEYYVDKDRLVGEALARLDGAADVIVMSDHGFSDFSRQVNINNWLLEQGYMQVKDREDTELLAQVDWSNTAAFALGFTSIFLNIQGREKHGILDPAQAERIKNEIRSKLPRLRDGDAPVINSTYAASETYSGEHVSLAPDIVVGYRPGFRGSWRNAVGGLDPETISDNESPWQGDHLIDREFVPGVVFSTREIARDNPDITDVAPTILKLYGIDPPADVDGSALF